MEDHYRVHLLLIDDDTEFHRKAKALSKLRFRCTMVTTGAEAERTLEAGDIDAILIDLGIGTDDGGSIVRRLRAEGHDLPIIAMLRSGQRQVLKSLNDVRIDATIEKPVNLDELTALILTQLQQDMREEFSEPSIDVLMVSPDLYPHLYLDEPVTRAIHVLKHAFFDAPDDEIRTRLRSSLVFDRHDQFQGIIHLDDILRLVHPESFTHSPYMSSYTGMFLSQTRSLTNKRVADILRDQPMISLDTPVMEAVHLMITYGMINLPVVEKGKLVGVLRDKDIFLEISRILNVD